MCKKFVVNNLYLGQRHLGWEVWTGKELIEKTAKSIRDGIKAGDEIYGLTIGADGELELDRENFFMVNIMEKRHIGNLTPMFETDSKVSIFYLVIGSHKEGDVTLYEMISSRFERLDVTKEKLSIMYEMGLINGGIKMENGEPVLPQMDKKAPSDKKGTITEENGKTAEKKKAAEKEKATEIKKAAEKEKATEIKKAAEKAETAEIKKAAEKKEPMEADKPKEEKKTAAGKEGTKKEKEPVKEKGPATEKKALLTGKTTAEKGTEDKKI